MITRLEEIKDAGCEVCLFYTPTGRDFFGECRRRPDVINKTKSDWCGEFIPEVHRMKEACPEYDCPGVCCPEHPDPKRAVYALETAPEPPPTAPTTAPDGPTAAPTAPAAPPHTPPLVDGGITRERCYRVEYRSGIVQGRTGPCLVEALASTKDAELRDSIVSVTLVSEVNLGFHKEV